ncbi:MAG: transposase/IS protein [bacterium ADurb.Bin157]|nr:MAG: transposase/IS protein [bacterium ADurb.Bin157]
MTQHAETVELLKELHLNGVLLPLDEIISDAEKSSASYSSFLFEILKAELEMRSSRKLKRSLSAAHFPSVKTFSDYKIGNVTGFSKIDLASIKDLRWLDNHENLLFFGPPGLGKTHLAIATGMLAIESGYNVSFERISNLLKLLKNAEIQRTAGFRIKRILKSDLVIIDEIGYTPIERREANLFFNLISELYENASVIITSNKGFDEWAEMMGDEVMTTAMLDRLLHHARIFNLDGKSFRINTKEK